MRGRIKGRTKGPNKGRIKGRIKGQFKGRTKGRIKGRIKGHIKGRIKGRIKGHIKARRNLPRLPNPTSPLGREWFREVPFPTHFLTFGEGFRGRRGLEKGNSLNHSRPKGLVGFCRVFIQRAAVPQECVLVSSTGRGGALPRRGNGFFEIRGTGRRPLFRSVVSVVLYGL